MRSEDELVSLMNAYVLQWAGDWNITMHQAVRRTILPTGASWTAGSLYGP
jgi:hypothetical protein